MQNLQSVGFVDCEFVLGFRNYKIAENCCGAASKDQAKDQRPDCRKEISKGNLPNRIDGGYHNFKYCQFWNVQTSLYESAIE